MPHPMTDAERDAWRVSLFASPEGDELFLLLWTIMTFADGVLRTNPEKSERLYDMIKPREGSLKEAIDEIDRIVTQSLKDFKLQHDIK